MLDDAGFEAKTRHQVLCRAAIGCHDALLLSFLRRDISFLYSTTC